MQLVAERLGDRHFRSIADFIQSHVGIQLPAAKRTMVEGRLRKRVRALDFASLDDYAQHVFADENLGDELIHLIDCVTTNKTDFFREPAHFAFLRETAVPGLVGPAARGGRRLKLWSAASSTGAEAYSMAMVLDDMARQGAPFAFSILGTDISTEVLATARAGIYSQDMLAQVPPAYRQRYVMVARDAARGEGRIVPELRSRVNFERLNLMDERYPIDRDVDVIFCRNVLIYFDKPTQKHVIERLAGHLRPNGYLIVGHSESAATCGVTSLKQVLPTVFQK